jgi:hypothetical protein
MIESNKYCKNMLDIRSCSSKYADISDYSRTIFRFNEIHITTFCMKWNLMAKTAHAFEHPLTHDCPLHSSPVHFIRVLENPSCFNNLSLVIQKFQKVYCSTYYITNT